VGGACGHGDSKRLILFIHIAQHHYIYIFKFFLKFQSSMQM
jgi:hypothetical protein